MACPRAALTTVLAAVLLAAPVRADEPEDADLARARAQLDASDYLAARDSLAAALAAGRSGPAELAEIYRLSGQVAGALGQPAAAEDFFRRLLALAPRATLPPGTSPKMARPFAAARAWAKDHDPLRVKVETAAAPPALTLVVLSDPHGMVASARATVRVAGRPEATVEGAGRDRIELALPRAARIDVLLAGLDEHGNRLVELGTADVPIVVVGAEERPAPPDAKPRPAVPPAPPPPPRRRALYARWWLWGGAALGFAAAGAWFGLAARGAIDDLEALNADSQNHRFEEALDVEDRARRDLLLFDVAAAAAGACAVAAVLLYLTEPRAEPPRAGRARVAPAPARGGAAVLVEIRF